MEDMILKRLYGMTEEEYEMLLQYYEELGGEMNG